MVYLLTWIDSLTARIWVVQSSSATAVLRQLERAFQLISSKGIAWHSHIPGIVQCMPPRSSDRADAVRIVQVESHRAAAAGQSRRHRFVCFVLAPNRR
jgi:hypothetical protein